MPELTDRPVSPVPQRLIDTHCHLNLPDFAEDLATVLDRAVSAGVEKIIVPGIDHATTESAKKMAEDHSAIFFACGIHPNESAGWQAGWAQQLEAAVSHPKCVAVGEIGLDYYREYSPWETQMAALLCQLDLAERFGLPVIIHCRQAFAALWPVLSAWHDRNPNNIGVLHAFDETAETVAEVTAKGFYIGIGGAYTYKNKPLREEILRAVPLEFLLFETDAPYLTPVPFRGKRNEPAYVRYTAEKAAAVKGIPPEKLFGAVYENSHRLFARLKECR